MVGVQVTLALAETLSQLGQHLFDGWRAQFELPEVCHHVRLPAAVHTPPIVPDEAENTQPAMVGIIAALGRSPSTFVLPLPCLPSVIRAIRLPVAESPASRRVARLLG